MDEDSYVVGIGPGSGAPEKLCVWLMSPGGAEFGLKSSKTNEK